MAILIFKVLFGFYFYVAYSATFGVELMLNHDYLILNLRQRLDSYPIATWHQPFQIITFILVNSTHVSMELVKP